MTAGVRVAHQPTCVTDRLFALDTYGALHFHPAADLASVAVDAVGDPYKNTIEPLIKIFSIVALLLVPPL